MAVPKDEHLTRAGRPPPSEWALPAESASIPWARQLAARWLAAAGASAPVSRDVQLVLSELVTNAVRASPPEVDIHIELTSSPLGWGVAVSDWGADFALPTAGAATDPLAAGGRGLQVVAGVAGPVSVHHDRGWTVVRTTVPFASPGDSLITPAGSGRSGR